MTRASRFRALVPAEPSIFHLDRESDLRRKLSSRPEPQAERRDPFDSLLSLRTSLWDSRSSSSTARVWLGGRPLLSHSLTLQALGPSGTETETGTETTGLEVGGWELKPHN